MFRQIENLSIYVTWIRSRSLILTFRKCSVITFYISYYLLSNWLLSNPEVHCSTYISPPLVPIFSKSYPISSITTHLLKSVLILSSHLRLGLPKGVLLSGFPTKTVYAFLDCSICAVCPAHLSCLDLRFLIMLVEKYNNYHISQHYVTFFIYASILNVINTVL